MTNRRTNPTLDRTVRAVPAPWIDAERAPAGQPFDPSPQAYPAEADETRASRHEEWRHTRARSR